METDDHKKFGTSLLTPGVSKSYYRRLTARIKEKVRRRTEDRLVVRVKREKVKGV